MCAADIEPLEPGLWFEALEKLLHRQAEVREGELPALLRHGYHLLQLTPRPLRALVRARADEAAFEEYLQAAAVDAAALALVAPPMLFQLSSLGMTHIEARVWLPGDTNASGVLAPSIGSALVGAWAKCLLELSTRALSPDVRDQAQHRAPGEPRQMPIRH